MRKLNKTVACLICLTVLCASIIFPIRKVSAEEMRITEDFNDLTPDESAAYSNLFSTLEGRNFNKIFQATTSASAHNLYKIVSDTGADGQQSSMLEIACGAGDYFSLPGKHPLSSGQIARFYYDINFKEWKDSNLEDSAVPNLQLAYGNACGMSVKGLDAGAGDAYFNKYKANPAVTYPMELDKWYTVVSEIRYKDDTSWKMKTLILDSATGEVLFSGDEGTNWETMISISIGKTSAVGDVRFRMDNVTLYIGTAADAPVVRKASVNNGDSETARNLPLVFDFALPVTGEVRLLNGDEPVAGAVSRSVGYNRISISYNGLLSKNTSYRLSFADVKNSDGIACAQEDIVFTTEDLHLWKDIEVIEASANGENTDIAFKMCDDFDYPVFSGAIVAAWYRDGVMLGIDLVKKDNFAVGTVITESFSLGGIPAAGDFVQLMQFDTTGSPVPLSCGMLAIQ